MAEIKDPPADLPTTDTLRDMEDPDAPPPTHPAYLMLGTTPVPFPNPPKSGDVVDLHVRWTCTGEIGPLQRKKGDKYAREGSVQFCINLGDPIPPDPQEEPDTPMYDEEPDAQYSMVDSEGKVDIPDDGDAEPAAEDEDPNPPFSDTTTTAARAPEPDPSQGDWEYEQPEPAGGKR